MTPKVRQGLGWLTVALLAVLVQLVIAEDERSGIGDLIGILARLAILICGFVGLTLLAWGLLRNK
jgi:hypothetical protein